MHVTPEHPRFQLSPTAEGLQASIPARRSLPAMLFLLVWLCVWGLGATQVTGQSFDRGSLPSTSFLALWLAAWTAAGLAATGTLLWQFVGRELLTVNATSLVHRIEILGLGMTRVYDITSVRALRAVQEGGAALALPQNWMPPFLGPARGALAFDYGSRTIRLVAGMDEAEAKALLPHLSARMPLAARQG